MQATSKDVKRQALRETSTPPDVECAKGVFQSELPISSVNFTNNMSIPQAMINMNETEHDTIFQLLTLKSYSTILRENF